MKLLRKAWYLIPATLFVGLSGCTDLPTASDLHQTSSDDFVALEWRAPLAQEIVALQVIGPTGGVMELRGTGVTIRFPEGAVSESVLMEARALQGSVVAFEFEVPGLTFDVPIEVRIDSEVVAGQWSEFLAVYFEGDSPSEGTLPPAGVSAAPVGPFKIIQNDSWGGDIVLEVGDDDLGSAFGLALFGHAVASG